MLMQICDSNSFGLRTAIYLLQKEDLEFVIIPMLHIGEKEFYQGVRKEIEKCDLVLFEGVRLNDLKWVFRSYRRMAKRLGLCYQNDELDMRDYPSKSLHIDYSESQAREEWGRIPWFSRTLFKLGYPLGLTFISFTETRKSFAEAFKREVTSKEDHFEFMKAGKSDSAHDFLFRKRESLILQQIDEQILLGRGKRKRIGIVYGAGHMKVVIDYLLRKHRFSVANSWFLTVLWFGKNRFSYKSSE